MPLQVEGRRIQMLGLAPSSNIMGSVRRARELSDIAPQYVAKSGLCTASELESSKGGSIRIQHVTGLNSGAEGKSRFPKLDECAHFHYEHVEIGPLQVSLVDEDDLKPLFTEAEEEKWWSLSVTSQNKTWLIRRSYENFRMLDQQLHRCIYDRKFSELSELRPEYIEEQENIRKVLSDYVTRFSVIAGNHINCGPVLNWLELDNRGHRLIVPDTDNCPINTPAVAAAYSVKRYTAQAPDEISFEVGDMISVIDMPPPEESIWWRGKKGFQVGFFPCECVAVIGDKVPRNLQFSAQMCQPTKPVLRKHGKLIAFFRSFILSRPSRRKLKQSGILKERVFGCDLGEHLLNSGHEIPMVLKCCVEFIETHGLIDGIYRLSGITSNIQKLRNAFDEDRVPALYEDEAILQDVHSVASLLKMYFRELPNPLCTYQLYHQFVGAVQATQGEDTRLLKMRDVVQKLPPPHYRTLEYLMKHLARVSEKGNETGMTSRNVAIVWAPNLLRCKELEVGSVAALQGVGVQAVVTEFLVCYADLIFCDRLPSFSLPPQQVSAKKCRPKSLAISTPTKLLSLEEARTRALLQAAGKTEQEYIEVGGGPANLPAKYHTVIELPGSSRKRLGSKRSPIGWKILFGKSGRGSQSRKETESKSSSNDFAFRPSKAVTELDLAQTRRRLRPAKSVESLSSTRNSGTFDFAEPLKGLDDLPNLSLLRNGEGKNNGHNRSVSHESYFDHLQDAKIEDESLDISEIQVNFELEESEMRIFSEDETLLSAGSGSLTSNTNSPRILPNRKFGKSTVSCVNKRLSCPKLAAAEDVLSLSQSADPSPKKQKTYDGVLPRSALEEQLSNSMGDIQFIDCVSTDQISVQAEVHPIQSPSPVSSISQLSSSLLPPSSPILPHIPHLRRPVSDTSTGQNVVEDVCAHKCNSSVSVLSGKSTNHPHSMVSKEMSPPSYLTSPSLVEVIVSDNESFSLQSSELTTPDTPLCRPYTPLVDFEESSVSNLTTPDLDANVKTVKSSSSETENLDKAMIKANLEFDEGKNIVEEFTQFDEKITSGLGVDSRDVYEPITTDMIKISKVKTEEVIPPKPEERKPRPVHPYVNIPFPKAKAGPRRVLETSFDLKDEPEKIENQCSGSSIRYECISTESSCDSLINMNKSYENYLPDLKFVDSSPVVESESPESPVQNSEKPSCPFSSSEVANKNCSEENTESGHLQDDMIFCTVNDSTEAESPVNVPMSCLEDESRQSMKWMETNIDEDCASPSRDVSLEETFKEEDVTVVKVTSHGSDNFEKDVWSVALKETESCESKREDEVEIGESLEDVVEKEKVEVLTKTLPGSDCSLQKSQPKKMLETNLDELCEFGTGSDDIDKKSPSKTINFPQKSNSSGNVRHLMSRFEISPTTEMSLTEIRSEYGSKTREEQRAYKKRTDVRKPLTNPVEGGIEERPKTLERLPLKRETDKYFSNSSEVQLGKSKSGSHIDEKKFDSNNRIDVLLNYDVDLSDPKRRERIEKYKEKRRNYLREKYRSDSFRTGEKDEIVCKIKQKPSRQNEDEDGRRGREKWEKSSSGSESVERSRLCGGSYSRQRKAPLKGSGLSQLSNPCQGSDGDSPTESCDSFKLRHDSKSPTDSGSSFLESVSGNDRTSSESFSPHSTRKGVGEKPEESHSSLSPTGDIVESQGSPTSFCIKAKAAFFEKRDDSNSPKQYLSSV